MLYTVTGYVVCSVFYRCSTFECIIIAKAAVS